MSLDLFLLPRAEADLDSICVFLAKQSAEKAFRFDKAAFASFDRICSMPMIGRERKFENPKLSGIRSWFVKGFEEYLIFYRPFETYVEIVRVLHSERDVDAVMREEVIN